MDHAANVVRSYQVFRNLAGERGFDLAAILAQLRRHELHAEASINLSFTLQFNCFGFDDARRRRTPFPWRRVRQLLQMCLRTGRIEKRDREILLV